MKTKFCIGFLSAFLVLAALLGIGYQLSYRYTLDKREVKLEETKD